MSLEKKKSILEKESLRRGRSLYLVRVAQEFALWASFSVSQPNLRPVFAVKQRRLVAILHRFSHYVRPSVCTLPLPFSVTVYIASMPPLMWSVTWQWSSQRPGYWGRIFTVCKMSGHVIPHSSKQWGKSSLSLKVGSIYSILSDVLERRNSFTPSYQHDHIISICCHVFSQFCLNLFLVGVMKTVKRRIIKGGKSIV